MGPELKALESPVALGLRGRDLISVKDLSLAEIETIFQLASELKALGRKRLPILEGKTLAMIFQKASTRTRVSFEVGMWQLGGYALFLGASELQLRRGETIADTARVLSRYVDGIMIRTFSHRDVEELARFADVPVINGLTDYLHPCQALTDFFTVLEKRGRVSGIRFAYVGDGNNVAHSLMLTGSKLGADMVLACPAGYGPDPKIVEIATEEAKKSDGSIRITADPREAVRAADVIYTDVWVSMGQEEEREERLNAFRGYQVNSQLVSLAKPDCLVMHCLPAHRGEEITDEVVDGPNSSVFDEAENRLHVQKAILSLLMRD